MALNNEQKLKELKKAETNRIIYITGGMVLGATAGFLLANKFKAKTLVKVLATVGGSVAVGLPIILLTNKTSKSRKANIKMMETVLDNQAKIASADPMKILETMGMSKTKSTEEPVTPKVAGKQAEQLMKTLPTTQSALPETLTGLNTPPPKMA
jgi:tRNA(Met) C34 N-acetyltransferase TmcA